MGIAAKVLICVACAAGAHVACNGQGSGIVCTHGEGRFSRASRTGVTVIVDAQKGDGFATRFCEAKLIWNKNEIAVAGDAWQADVDVMDVDFGLGANAVAFQIKRSENSSSMTYLVYSLQGAPKLVRTITGGDSFRAADTDMDGRVEIWASDATATSDFDGIPAANIDFPPTKVMRFEKQHLIDVSSAFRPYYDRVITQLKTELIPKQQSDFKNSDGRFNTIPPWETDRIRSLQNTKIKTLEIVWAYLYSGREQQAWQALTEMWPAADLPRIRASIAKARTDGISSQVDGISPPVQSPRKVKHVRIYNLTTVEKIIDIRTASPSNIPEIQTSTSTSHAPLPENAELPIAISLQVPTPSDSEHVLPREGLLVDLVIDIAGKVSSAKLIRKEDEVPGSDSLLAASAHWKFIPAMEFGQAVASHFRLIVSPYQ